MGEAPRVHNKHHNTAPPGSVYIGRGSPYGNPYRMDQWGSREEVIKLFETHILPKLDLRPLRGKHLVCFCKPLACHGDVLLEAVKQKYGAVEVGKQLEEKYPWGYRSEDKEP